jgi:hypothetical protein
MMDAKSTSTGMHNWIVLCESIFGLTPFFLIEGVADILNRLRKYLPYHQIILTTRPCRGIH